jgi:hypothetical protein
MKLLTCVTLRETDLGSIAHLEVGDWIPLLAVDEAREEDGVAQEEDRRVVANLKSMAGKDRFKKN